MINLKKCPFCGGEATLEYTNDNKHRPYVVCKFGTQKEPKCPASIAYHWHYHTEEEAITAWNRRANDDTD